MRNMAPKSVKRKTVFEVKIGHFIFLLDKIKFDKLRKFEIVNKDYHFSLVINNKTKYCHKIIEKDKSEDKLFFTILKLLKQENDKFGEGYLTSKMMCGILDFNGINKISSICLSLKYIGFISFDNNKPKEWYILPLGEKYLKGLIK